MAVLSSMPRRTCDAANEGRPELRQFRRAARVSAKTDRLLRRRRAAADRIRPLLGSAHNHTRESGMSSASDDNRFAPPLAHVEDVAQGPGVLAGRWIRLGATMIDAVVATLAFGVIALVSPINVFQPSLSSSSGLWLLMVQNLVLGFILFLVIHGYLIATRGQTVGKALLKIRIVRSDGSPASFARIVGLRYLTTSVLAAIPVVGTIYGLVDVLLIFRASRRCLHDQIADTIVVTA
jgi:uncharacterized RDD family membrane protein YckC